MNRPPEPPSRSVYRRRRAVAAGGAAATLVLLIWGLSSLFSGSPPPTPRYHGTARDVVAAGRTSPKPPPVEPAGEGPASAGASSSASAPPPSAPSAPASASASVTPSATPAPPPPPRPCPDSGVVLAATVGKPSYPAAAKPKLGMTVISIASYPCTRDVGRGLRNLVVRSADGKREWANNDCYFGHPKPDVKTLQPGQQLHFELDWTTRSSSAGCPVSRHNIPPGSYTLTAELGTLASAPTPFKLT